MIIIYITAIGIIIENTFHNFLNLSLMFVNIHYYLVSAF